MGAKRGALTFDRVLYTIGERSVPDTLVALLSGKPGKRSEALAQLLMAEEQRRLLDMFRVVEKVTPPVVVRPSDEAQERNTQIRKERREMRLQFYREDKERREKAELERKKREEATRKEAALRKRVDDARKARERAEAAAERAAMQKLEEEEQAEMSRRGADTVDFSHQLLDREPDALTIQRVCAKAALKAGVDAVRLEDCGKVNLANNEILALAESFLFRILQVRVLDLSNNRLTSVPAALGGMGQLEILKLNGNILEGLPSRLGRLERLRMLDLRGNRLNAYPPEMLGLPALEVLLLSGNDSLKVLPEPYSGTAESRAKASVEAAMAAAKSLVGGGVRTGANLMSHEASLAKARNRKAESKLGKEMDKTGAPLESFRPKIFPRLVCLDLSCCGIETMPYDSWWLRLPCLSELKLDGNPLTSFAIDFGPVKGTAQWIRKDETSRRRAAMDKALGLRARVPKAAKSSKRASSELGEEEQEAEPESDDDSVDSEREAAAATVDAEEAAAKAAAQVPPWLVPRLRISVSNLASGKTAAGFEGLATLTVDPLDVLDAVAGVAKPGPNSTAGNLCAAIADEYEVTIVGGVRVYRKRDPENFQVIPTTHTVLMRNAGIRTLPKTLRPWGAHLQYLDLSKNFLRQLPDPAMGRLVSLRALNVSGNLLDSIPRSLCSLTNLRHLDISNNPAITQLPEEFGAMKNLRTFLCRDNRSLHKLPQSFKLLHKLRRMDLAHCSRMTTIRVKLHRLTALTALRCTGCTSMDSFPGAGAVKKGDPTDETAGGILASTSITGSITMGDETLNATELFDTEEKTPAGPGKQTVQTHPPSPPPNLRFLDLSESGVTEIDMRSLKQMPKLRVLELRHTGMTSLPPQLTTHKKLKVLDVRNNMLESLPKEFIRWFIHDPRDAKAASIAVAPAAQLYVEPDTMEGGMAGSVGESFMDVSELSDEQLGRIIEAADASEHLLRDAFPLVTLLARRAVKERSLEPRRIVSLPPLRVRVRVSGNPLRKVSGLAENGRSISFMESLAGKGPMARRRLLKERWKGADLADVMLEDDTSLAARLAADEVDKHFSKSAQKRASLSGAGSIIKFRERQKSDWEDPDPGASLRASMNRALKAARSVPATLRSDVVWVPPPVHGASEPAGTMTLLLQEHQAETLHGGERWRELSGGRGLFDEDSEEEGEVADGATGPRSVAPSSSVIGGNRVPSTSGPRASMAASSVTGSVAASMQTKAKRWMEDADSGDEEAWACGVFDFGETAQGFEPVGAGVGTFAPPLAGVYSRGGTGLARVIAQRRAFEGRIGGRLAASRSVAGVYGGAMSGKIDSMGEIVDPGATTEEEVDLRVYHAMLLKDCLDRGEFGLWCVRWLF
jgi:Leucine-rich repeat (LRR) protein